MTNSDAAPVPGPRQYSEMYTGRHEVVMQRASSLQAVQMPPSCATVQLLRPVV